MMIYPHWAPRFTRWLFRIRGRSAAAAVLVLHADSLPLFN